MTPDRWSRLKELFEFALERPPAERMDLVTRLCGGDPALESELRRLIEHECRLGTFLDADPAPKARLAFSDGQVIAGRYEIVRFIGRGGMGEVYAAEDRVLRVAVALKTVRPQIAHDPKSHERLRREIQLARSVTHPNVCRVFDIGENPDSQEQLFFLTMELLTGETLGERIARDGPIRGNEAFSIARGIAEGLQAAHRAGVVHRDLKPANIMMQTELESVCRPILMDFGLADREVPAGDRLTAEHHIIGTLAYMAPELVDGAPASASSDIYAFGVTLYEMVTGHKPFPAGETLSSALRRSPRDLRTPSHVVSGLSERWDAAIAACLEPAPENRCKSAAQVMEVLTGALSPGARSPAPRHKKIRPALWIASSVFLLALIAFGLRLYLQRPVFPGGSNLMLADIENATGDRELDATTAVFRNQLEQSGHLRLWDGARAGKILQTMHQPPGQPIGGKLARELGMRDGVPYVLFGSVAPLAGGLSLNLQLDYLSNTSIFARNSWTFSAQAAGKPQLHDAIHEGSLWVRRVLGESAKELSLHDRLPQDTTTRSWEALGAFAQAERFNAQHQTDTAIALLKQSTHYDTHFALAYMRLGDLLTSTYRREEGLRYWQLAQDETNRQHLTRREELRIRGLFSSDTEDFAVAEAAFAQMEVEFPRDYLASFYLASALRWQGRLQESIRKLLDADSKQPNSLSVIASLAHGYLLLGKLPETTAQIDRLRRLNYGSYAAHYRGLLQYAAGDYLGALESFRQEAGFLEPGCKSVGGYYHAGLLCEMGRLAEARKVLEDSRDPDTETTRPELRANRLIALAYIEWKTGHPQAARSACLDAVSRNPSPALAARVGALLAQAGYPEDARKVERGLNRDVEAQSTAAARARLSGEINLAEGHLQFAMTDFQKLDSLAPALRFRDWLARAYVRQGSPEKASPYYHALASSTDLWQALECDYPGLFSDIMLGAAQAAWAAGDRERARWALSLYLKRRGSGDPTPELAAANRLKNSVF